MPELPRARSAVAPEGSFVDLSRWWKTLVTGGDAGRWLGDLLTADVTGIPPGRAARSLLLGPTGRIRADLTVAALADAVMLVQDPDQPGPVMELLRPYVLSADVRIEDRTEAMGLVAFPGGEPPTTMGQARWTPSCLGSGVDVLVEGSTGEVRRAAEAAGLRAAAEEEVEAWRVARGAARFPVDLSETSLPHEAALDRLVDPDKGCFLGQEAVAKVRNLGHPPWLVLAGRTAGTAAPGDPVVAGEREVGAVTSAAPVDGETAVIIRVRWEARDRDLRIDGAPVRETRPASGTA